MSLLANSHQIRQADQLMIKNHQVPGIILMETAGRKATELLLRLYPTHMSFLVLAGPGNNGGDGLVMARYLHLAGKEVRVLYSHDPESYQGDAQVNELILRHLPVLREQFSATLATHWLADMKQSPVLIDSLLGTGIRSALREPIASMLGFFKEKALSVVAIDLPTGLSADSGELITQPLRATHTFTFQLPKICHYVTPASLECGQIHVIDIDIWPAVIDQLEIQRWVLDPTFVGDRLKTPRVDAHKGSQGHVLVVGGSRDMSGAVAMTAWASLKSGAGLCTVLTPLSCRSTVLNWVPEAMCRCPESESDILGQEAAALFEECIRGKSAVVIGPGMGTHLATLEWLRAVLPLIRVPLLLDADGLNLLAAHADLWKLLPPVVVLTPHPGEMRRLTNEDVLNRRLETAEQLAKERNVVVVLKGAGTLIAAPDGKTFVNTSGNPGMATGGAGDVLSGTIGALLAQGYEGTMAAAIGVYVHGKAGDLAADDQGAAGVTATDIIRKLGLAFQIMGEKDTSES